MIEIRDAGAHHWEATSHPTTWSGVTPPYFIASRKEGTFLEQIRRGAFDDAISGQDAVELRVQHRADGPVLASTNNKTLRYSDADRGLLQVALLSKSDPEVVDAVAKIRSNAYGGLSVGMLVHDDEWGTASDGATALRTITRASLIEVSVVNRPANPHAQMLALRQENRSASGALIEYRSFLDEPVDLSFVDPELIAEALRVVTEEAARRDPHRSPARKKIDQAKRGPLRPPNESDLLLEEAFALAAGNRGVANEWAWLRQHLTTTGRRL